MHIVTFYGKILKLKLTVVNWLKHDVFVNVDDAERFHANVRETKKKNTSLTNENTRLQVLSCCCFIVMRYFVVNAVNDYLFCYCSIPTGFIASDIALWQLYVTI